ncbi:MAG: hypothetical protein CVV27_06870, partial [Candidatus Melainabacteria bacterium HGW-Melainabacteria-1]
MRVLLISNGSGEDRIAVQLARAWRMVEPELELEALVLVGEGLFYQRAGIELLPPRFNPPSQGFAYLHPDLLWQDVCAGLGRHLRQSLDCLKARRGHYTAVLAVGDIVAAFAASRLHQPFAFYGSALSDYYLGQAGEAGKSSYDSLQIRLLRSALVFARDALTAANLRRRGLNAHFDGNPMLDCFDDPSGDYLDGPSGECPYRPDPTHPAILLLPGSHADAPANFGLMLRQLMPLLDQPLDYLLIQAPQLTAESLPAVLRSNGWDSTASYWMRGQARLWLLDTGWFRQAIDWGRLAIGLAGTANEQCVGLGLPVISFATPGHQYSWAFGEAQQRLLGAGLQFLGDPHPQLLAWQVKRMLAEPGYRA